jgi:hypothetical protein
MKPESDTIAIEDGEATSRSSAFIPFLRKTKIAGTKFPEALIKQTVVVGVHVPHSRFC